MASVRALEYQHQPLTVIPREGAPHPGQDSPTTSAPAWGPLIYPQGIPQPLASSELQEGQPLPSKALPGPQCPHQGAPIAPPRTEVGI